jgi:hypothetical protein
LLFRTANTVDHIPKPDEETPCRPAIPSEHSIATRTVEQIYRPPLIRMIQNPRNLQPIQTTHTHNQKPNHKMGLFETLRAKLEIYRLEQRYTRRDKRSTWVSGAQYVDGEYVYGNESTVTSPTSSTSSRGSGFTGKMAGVKVAEVFSSGRGGDKRRSKVW